MATPRKPRRGPKTAAESDEVTRPNDWDKCVSSAYLRMLGMSQKEAAEKAGVGERTLRSWEACGWWPEAQAEAMSRWLSGMRSKVLESLNRHVPDDGTLALKVGERIVPELAPAKERREMEISGPDGGSIEVTVTRRVVGE